MFETLFYISLALPMISVVLCVLAMLSTAVTDFIKVRYMMLLLLINIIVLVIQELMIDPEAYMRIDLFVVIPALVIHIISIVFICLLCYQRRI